MTLTVHTFVTLDGVMQGPGASDEDRSGGFERGGWLMPLTDEGFGRIVDGWFAQTDALLLGRTTYGLFAAYWPQVTDPDNTVAHALNTAPKDVVSTTLTDPTWADTVVVSGDTDAVVGRIRELKAQPGRELQVQAAVRDRPCPAGFELVTAEQTATGCRYMVLRPAGGLQVATATVEDGRDVVR